MMWCTLWETKQQNPGKDVFERGARKAVRAARTDEYLSMESDANPESEDEEVERIARAPGRPPRTRTRPRVPDPKIQADADDKAAKSDANTDQCIAGIIRLEEMIKGFTERLDKVETAAALPAPKPPRQRQTAQRNRFSATPISKANVDCFRCGQLGHYANECTYQVAGQFSVTAQPVAATPDVHPN